MEVKASAREMEHEGSLYPWASEAEVHSHHTAEYSLAGDLQRNVLQGHFTFLFLLLSFPGEGYHFYLTIDHDRDILT